MAVEDAAHIMGSTSSEAKARAARLNGKLGGRPRLSGESDPIKSGLISRRSDLANRRIHSSTSRSTLILADAFEWLEGAPANSIHAIVTDPPYGVKEYELEELAKKEAGSGGMWRIPPSFDGSQRSALPRFTALTPKERDRLERYFQVWAALCVRVLRPGAHVFVASNSFLSQLVFSSLAAGGLEFRGELIRLVRTMRGGDKPKGAEKEFPFVCSLPRGCYEPWGVFRKPLPKGMKVSECLNIWGTGGLRRISDDQPFNDVILSERTPQSERKIASHPSLKPQSMLRKIVRASLPLGEGYILDPFCGSGSTLAAAEAMGLESVGLERYPEYYSMAKDAIPKLARVPVRDNAAKRSQLNIFS